MRVTVRTILTTLTEVAPILLEMIAQFNMPFLLMAHHVLDAM